MGNVTVRDSTVQSVHSNDSITVFQNITWEAPPNHHSIQYYVVKYQMQGQATSSKSMRTSNNVTQATLVLLVPRGKTSTHSVWVAAVSETGQGEFSDRVDFKYSSKPKQSIYPCPHTVQLLALLYLSCPCRTRRIHTSTISQPYMQQHQHNMVCPKVHWRSASGELHSEVEWEGLTTDDCQTRCDSSDSHTSVAQHFIHY